MLASIIDCAWFGLKWGLYALLGFVVAMLVVVLVLRLRIDRYRKQVKKDQFNDPNVLLISFFHPFCNDMGGGEKVLYKMIEALLQSQQRITGAIGRNFQIAIYCAALASPLEIISRVKNRFNIDLPDEKVRFERLRKGDYLNADKYPTFTMLRQAFNSAFVILEALTTYPTDVLIDTMGFGWIYPVAKLICPGIKVVSYSHYPFISSDMLTKVEKRTVDFNNAADITSSTWKTKVKSLYPVLAQHCNRYYRFILLLYRFVGRFADLVMTNSSWTYNHFADLWKSNIESIYKLYPPCTVDKYLEIQLDRPRRRRILSIGQFRPEKNQRLQVEIMKKIIEADESLYKDVVLVYDPLRRALKQVIAGSCRSADDDARYEELYELVRSLKMEKYVTLKKNLQWKEMFEEMKQSMIGLHTMKDEHFGIVVVELMAAGLVTVAHNSAGPKLDIVGEPKEGPRGYLAETAEDFVKHIRHILDTYERDNMMMDLRSKARAHVQTFSDQAFMQEFMRIFDAFVLKNYARKAKTE